MINLVLIYSILTISMNFLLAYTGQLSLGHGAFMAVGAYSSTIFTQTLGLPLPFSIILAGMVTGLAGYLIGLPALRLKGHYLAIMTLCFGIIIPEAIPLWKSVTGGFIGLESPKFHYFDFIFSYRSESTIPDGSAYYVCLIVLAAVCFFTSNLINSRTGRAFSALTGNESAAKSLGINVVRYKLLAFFYCAFFAGIAGALYAHLIGYIEPDQFNFWMSVFPLLMMFMGGVGSNAGCIIGAFVIMLLPDLVTTFVAIPNMPYILLSLSLILVLVFLPNGIVSSRPVVFISSALPENRRSE